MFYSRKPLDVDAFYRCFQQFGDTERLEDGSLICFLHNDEGSYEFMCGPDDTGMEEFSPAELAHIVAVVGTPQPFCTGMVHRRKMPNQVLLCLPAWDDIWVSEEADLLFSLKEVQQRIKLGVEYMGRAERDGSVDLVVFHKGQNFRGALVMLDDGKKSDAAQREAAFRERLARYAAYFASTEAPLKEHGLSSYNPLIEVVCAAPPTPGMRAITSVSDRERPQFVLPVELVTEDEFRERHGFVPRDLPSLRDRY
jgi:hypothetical protein